MLLNVATMVIGAILGSIGTALVCTSRQCAQSSAIVSSCAGCTQAGDLPAGHTFAFEAKDDCRPTGTDCVPCCFTAEAVATGASTFGVSVECGGDSEEDISSPFIVQMDVTATCNQAPAEGTTQCVRFRAQFSSVTVERCIRVICDPCPQPVE